MKSGTPSASSATFGINGCSANHYPWASACKIRFCRYHSLLAMSIRAVREVADQGSSCPRFQLVRWIKSIDVTPSLLTNISGVLQTEHHTMRVFPGLALRCGFPSFGSR